MCRCRHPPAGGRESVRTRVREGEEEESCRISDKLLNQSREFEFEIPAKTYRQFGLLDQEQQLEHHEPGDRGRTSGRDEGPVQDFLSITIPMLVVGLKSSGSRLKWLF